MAAEERKGASVLSPPYLPQKPGLQWLPFISEYETKIVERLHGCSYGLCLNRLTHIITQSIVYRAVQEDYAENLAKNYYAKHIENWEKKYTVLCK